MKKKLKVVLISLAAATVLIVGLRLYPVLADDSNLVFEPIQQEEPIAYKEFLSILRDDSYELTLTTELKEKIQLALEEPNLSDFRAALGIIRRLKEKGTKLPPAWNDRDFLSERLIVALKNDVHYLYQHTQEGTNLTKQIQLSSLDDSEFKKKADYLKLRMIEIFTYQENKTFNTLWRRIEDFEANPSRGIQIEVDPREFGYDNFFGKFLLACVTPSLSKTVENINEIGSNQAGDDNSE